MLYKRFKKNIFTVYYPELQEQCYPIETDLIYDSVLNQNTIYTIDFSNRTDLEFKRREHINYLPVVVSNINRFKINVSDDLLRFLKQNNKNIKITLHFKNRDG